MPDTNTEPSVETPCEESQTTPVNDGSEPTAHYTDPDRENAQFPVDNPDIQNEEPVVTPASEQENPDGGVPVCEDEADNPDEESEPPVMAEDTPPVTDTMAEAASTVACHGDIPAPDGAMELCPGHPGTEVPDNRPHCQGLIIDPENNPPPTADNTGVPDAGLAIAAPAMQGETIDRNLDSPFAMALDCVKETLQNDQDLANGWHDNVAMGMLDALPDEYARDLDMRSVREVVNDGAAIFMKRAFDVDTRQHALSVTNRLSHTNPDMAGEDWDAIDSDPNAAPDAPTGEIADGRGQNCNGPADPS